MQLYNEVIFFHGQSIDEEKATTLGIGDLFQSFLALIDHMRRLHLDQYECVALKVIILICPGNNRHNHIFTFSKQPFNESLDFRNRS